MTNRISPELDTYHPEVIESPNHEVLAVRFDVASLLESNIGPDWQRLASEAITKDGRLVIRDGNHHTVREPVGRFGLVTCEGGAYAQKVPGMWGLYRGVFKQMMQASLPAGLEPLNAYDDPDLGLEAVAQQPTEPDNQTQHRYEAHVDQRYTGVLVLKAPDSAEQGGRLVIANNQKASSLEEIFANATYVAHRPGTLVCFSQGRFYPHLTEEVTDPDSERVTISLNYPVEGETLEEAEAIVAHAMGKQNNVGGEHDA